jgi:hypothetical protein
MHTLLAAKEALHFEDGNNIEAMKGENDKGKNGCSVQF